MYTLNIIKTMKNIPAIEIRDFIIPYNYKLIRFSKQNSYYSMKRLKNCC